MNNDMPLARTKNLILQEAGDELLLYDQLDHRAHCLNPLASMVWRLADGQKSTKELAELVSRKLHIAADHQIIELALQELDQANLMNRAPKLSASQTMYTRRCLTARLVGTAAAIVLGSLVVTARAHAQGVASAPVTTTTTTTVAPLR